MDPLLTRLVIGLVLLVLIVLIVDFLNVGQPENRLIKGVAAIAILLYVLVPFL